MDLGLKDKVALVTGASRGIGLAVTTLLVEEGMQVSATSRSGLPPDHGAVNIPLDMQAADSGDVAVAACIERFGRLDVLVNNVGSGRIGTGFTSESDEVWEELWNLNFMSAVRTSRSALPHLTEPGGVIVNVSRINGAMPEAGIYSYSATKAAMNNMTVGLAREVASRGIRVVGVAPGPVSTPLWLGSYGVAAQASALGAGEPADIVAAAERAIPLGRFSTAEEIAAAVAFLASPQAGFHYRDDTADRWRTHSDGVGPALPRTPDRVAEPVNGPALSRSGLRSTQTSVAVVSRQTHASPRRPRAMEG